MTIALQSGPDGALTTRPKQADIWYREPWLLLVVGGPALVVVASFITLYLAITRPDPLVSKDYYRDGLRINQTLAAEEAARVLALNRSHKIAPANAAAMPGKGEPTAPVQPNAAAAQQVRGASPAAGTGAAVIPAHLPSDEVDH